MSQRRTTCLRPGVSRGFTLIELAVIVAVIGIIAAIAVPSLQMLINASRLNGAASELTAALQLARSEAIRRNSRVTVCGSSDGAACASAASWSQFIVRQPNGTADDPAVIRSFAPSGSLQISGPTGGIVFRPSGLIESEQKLGVSMSSNDRCISVKVSGVVSVAKGACS